LWLPGDFFQNYKLAPQIGSKTLILHGDCDKVIPYECGEKLSTLFKNCYRFVTLRHCGHNDIFTNTYYDEIKNFIESK
jgi:pimeloyl-ACP methyl ester carboxylesterase